MPRIAEYTSQENLNPQVFEGAAYSLERYGRIAGEEISRGTGALAQGFGRLAEAAGRNEAMALQRKMTDYENGQLQLFDQAKQTADPNDPEAFKDFYTKLNDGLDKFGEDLGSPQAQEVYTTMRDRTSAMFMREGLSYQHEMAGNKLKADYEGVVNTLGANAALNPASLKDQLLRLKDSSNLLPPTAGPDAYAQASKHIVKSAGDSVVSQAISSAMTTGDVSAIDSAGKFLLNKDGDYVKNGDAADITDWENKLNEARGHIGEVARSQAAEEKRQRTEDFRQASLQVTSGLYDQDGNFRLPKNYFAQVTQLHDSYSDVMTSGEYESMMKAGRAAAEQRAPVQSDPQTYSNFRERAFLGSGDPRQLSSMEVYQAMADGKISTADARIFLGAAGSASKLTPEQKDFSKFLTSMKPFITKSNLLKTDGYGDQKWYEFQSDAQRAYAAARDKGESIQQAQQMVRQMIGQPQYHYSTKEGISALQTQAAGGTIAPLARAGDTRAYQGKTYTFTGGDQYDQKNWVIK